MTTISIEKDIGFEKPIPTLWHHSIIAIVEAIKSNDLKQLNNINGIQALTQTDINRFRENIEEYGCNLASLPSMTWQTSVCQWMGDGWEVLIDLFTIEEGLSDLALSMKIVEKGKEFEFRVTSIYVP